MTEHVDVFISSTFSDLEEFRLEIRNVIISLGMYPIDMVDFEPSNRNAMQMCYDKLQDAEIFIGIYAHRYGYAPKDDISFKTHDGTLEKGDGERGITHWEYLWAQEKGIPCLLFLLDEEVAWPPKQMDKGKAAKALKAFKATLKNNHIVKFFADKNELTKEVALGLQKTKPEIATKAESSWRALRAPETPYYFAGRAAETAKLFELLAKAKTVLMTGMGGTGKTTLAKHLGKEALKDYNGGVLWLQLNPELKKAEDAQRLAIAAWKEANPKSRDTNAEISPAQLKALLGEAPAPLLAILDDAWSSEVITGIRACLPEGTPLLITTRDVNLATPKTGERYELKHLTEDDALKFLSQRLNLNGAHAPDLREISALVGHHALALDLVAAWLERESLNDMPALKRKLSKPQGLFKTLDMGESRDENLEKALALSYLPLDEEYQLAFRLLAALPNSLDFTPELAIAVWSIDEDSDEEKENADDRLRDLTRRGLLERLSNGRYFLHQTLHAYASKLMQDKEENAALDTARERYYTKLTKLARGFFDLPMQDWFSKLEDPYLQHFFRRGEDLLKVNVETDTEEKVREALEFFVNIRKIALERPQHHLLRWLEKGLEACQKLQERSREALFLNELGTYYVDRSQPEKALNYFEQALMLRREQKNKREEATLLNNIGMIYDYKGDLDQALDYYKQALITRSDVSDRFGDGTTLNNIGMIYKAKGNLDQALDYYKQALLVHREENNRLVEGATLNNIGMIYKAKGNLDQALDYYKQALTIRREVGDRRGESTSFWNMGLLYEKKNDLDKAIECIEACIAIEKEIQHPDYESDRAYLEELKAQRDGG